MFEIITSPAPFSVREDIGSLTPIVVSLITGTLPFSVDVVINDFGTATSNGKAVANSVDIIWE